MTLTFLVFGGLTVTILAVSVVLSRKYDLVEPLLAGEATAVGLADPAAETMNGHNGPAVVIQNDWHLATVPALHEAEDLLDCLESQGYHERELIVLGNSSFAVRWR